MVWTVVKFLLLVLAALEVLVITLAIRRRHIPERFRYIAILVGITSIAIFLPVHKWVQMFGAVIIALPLIFLVLGVALLTMIAGK